MLWSSLIRDHVVVCDDMTVPDARRRLDQDDVNFVLIVTSDAHPLGVLSGSDLDSLADATESLALLAHRFPSLVIVEVEGDELSLDELLDVAELIGREGLDSVLVENEGQPVGVLLRAAVAEVLPLDALDGRSAARAGNPNVPALQFVCRKCSPPSYRRLRAPTPDGQPPDCRRVFFHGAMEVDD